MPPPLESRHSIFFGICAFPLWLRRLWGELADQPCRRNVSAAWKQTPPAPAPCRGLSREGRPRSGSAAAAAEWLTRLAIAKSPGLSATTCRVGPETEPPELMFSYQQTHPSRLESCLQAVQVATPKHTRKRGKERHVRSTPVRSHRRIGPPTNRTTIGCIGAAADEFSQTSFKTCFFTTRFNP